MSQGKYSPTVYRFRNDNREFVYNAKSELPPEYKVGDEYSEEVHFGNYDKEGFDSYGYSAYDSEGNYVGVGSGVDRNGYTENEYLVMSPEEYEDFA